MRRTLINCTGAIAARWGVWLGISLGWLVVYYSGLLVALVVQFGDWPNYVTYFNWPENVAHIFRSTPSLTDAIAISREEWLVEIGYLNTDFGMGISEWSLTLVPEKMLMMLIMGMLLATIWALNAARTRVCSFSEGGTTVTAAGAGAGFVALTGATMTWVVCCATPSWIVGLTMLGMSVAMADWLEPVGIWLNVMGFALLATTAFIMAARLNFPDQHVSSQSSAPQSFAQQSS
ncbi:MAG: hypothetical protein KTR19_09480 [Hyphomicrobiales bacterium]|nr:hypothetical protein [Hyphomicrobiales bacterium]